MKRAAEIGVDHITITDHQTLAGHRAFQDAGRENGISIGLGLEGYISETDRFDKRAKAKRTDGTEVYNHIGIIAKNEAGLKNLYALNNEAWASGFYHKPRMDFELLEEFSEDLIVLSGCLSGLVAKALAKDDLDAAMKWAGRFKAVFKDDYYIEVMSHNPKKINDGLFLVADTLGIKPIITSDCHHAKPEDAVVQEAMLILATAPKKGVGLDMTKANKMELLDRFNYLYPDRGMNFEEYDLHLHHGLEQFENMKAKGYDRTDFVENTNEIADKIGEYPVYKDLDLLPKPATEPNALLRKRAYAGLKMRNLGHLKEYVERLEFELKVITEKNFASYFHIEYDAVAWAKSQGILVGPGRGSSAGSLLCYCLRITEVDPIPHNLLFSRFLDMHREDWPDIDTDFEDVRRDEVKQWTAREYTHTSNIMTFTYLEGKNILKDAANILCVPYKEVDDLAKNIIDWDDYCSSPKAKLFRQKYPDVQKLGDKMRGRLRSVGMHAAGVVVSSEPISNYAPIETATHPDDKAKDRVPVLAMDGDAASAIGFIKFDFLGLKALTNIQHAVNLIEQRTGIVIKPWELNLNDSAVYSSITKSNTLGIFQMEGSAFTKILDKMPIENFNDLVTSTALIRPGASDSSFGGRFLYARNGGDWKPYCKEMMPFTKDTYGEILYQEQLMLTCTVVAGMSDQDANRVRKIIGKKRDVAELDKYKEMFIEGATEKLGVAGAKRMWTDFEKSANYQFNKSHAVAYSMISFATAYLKHYYPLEFMLSLLKAEEDDTMRVEYLMDAKNQNIIVKTPKVNHSLEDISIQKHNGQSYLLMGLKDIKNIGDAAAAAIIERRPFTSYQHLQSVSEEKYNKINKRTLESLNAVGAAEFADNPLVGDEKDNYYEYLSIPMFNTDMIPDYAKIHIRSVDQFTETETFVMSGLIKDITRKNGWARADILDPTGSVSVFFSPGMELKKGEYYVMLISNKSLMEFMPLSELDSDRPLAKYLMTEKFKAFDGYRVISFVPRKTKKGDNMANLVVTDRDKRLTGMLVWPRQFPTAHTHARPGNLVRIKVGTKYDRGQETVFLDSIGVIQ